MLVAAIIGAAMVAPADARLGGGGSFGSRGSRTFSMPGFTHTAPRVAPIQRSTTAAPFNRPTTGAFGASRPGFFGGGFGRGLLGGFLGAGLFGLLFGHGFGGGLGGGMSLIGLLLQLALIFFIGRWVLNYFRNRNTAYGGVGGSRTYGPGIGFGLGGSGSTTGHGAAQPAGVPITIGPDDYHSFERRLIDSQQAYSKEDLGTLRQLATPEMYGNFQRELADNERQGVTNQITDVRLLQGDLSEAWREGQSDYATVAMRFSLVDITVEKASGRIVAGSPSSPQEVTEVWTFMRPTGSGSDAWALSAIQQA